MTLKELFQKYVSFMNNIAIIPARGGSKRIPRKNIKDFKGKPIISYSIIEALKTQLFDEIMVSTDDLEISEISQLYGANVPFLRSKKNSNDYASTAEVLIEVLNSYLKIGIKFENVCCIYPTAPFVTSNRLIEGFKMLNNGADLVLPVQAFDYPIFRSFSLNENGYLDYNWKEFINSRSQDLPLSYHDAGQWYWVKANQLLETGKLNFKSSKGLPLASYEAQDIDTIHDWKLAELKYEYLQSLK